jgi:hypothetical protein
MVEVWFYTVNSSRNTIGEEVFLTLLFSEASKVQCYFSSVLSRDLSVLTIDQTGA